MILDRIKQALETYKIEYGLPTLIVISDGAWASYRGEATHKNKHLHEVDDLGAPLENAQPVPIHANIVAMEYEGIPVIKQSDYPRLEKIRDLAKDKVMVV